ncbi:deoxyhypusine synthase family protein [Ancylomarina sp. DW003]|nr:deoxyhypusine synthase family protein [Ancylomarina sp. DW003]MDE5421079.1 deoxyhypusine synthase family protein [Ancylomarina sp. DW003]
MKKKELLKNKVKTIDITSFDSSIFLGETKNQIDDFKEISEASLMYSKMLNDKSCNIILSISGNNISPSYQKIYSDMIKYNLVDAIVASGETIIDVDFFESLGFNYYEKTNNIPTKKLREFYINQRNNLFVDEDDMHLLDNAIKEIADQLEPKSYSSSELIYYLGQYLEIYSTEKDSIIQLAYQHGVPILCPDLAYSRFGIGLLKHFDENPNRHISIDPIKELKEFSNLKAKSNALGLISIGDDYISHITYNIVKYSEQIGGQSFIFKYAIHLSDSNIETGDCSSTKLDEAISRGCLIGNNHKFVNVSLDLSLPLLINSLYQSNTYITRNRRNIYPK